MKRRTLLLGSVALAAGAAAPWLVGKATHRTPRTTPIEPATPRKAAVLWFSQTGHSRRIGRLIAHQWRTHGLEIVEGSPRDADPGRLVDVDLVMAGAPVHYYEAPTHFHRWLRTLPLPAGHRCAAFVTFGGPGGNQENAVAGLLATLAGRGGLPMDGATFGNMSTFAPTWSLGNHARILRYRHLPNAGTWQAVRDFASRVLDRVTRGHATDSVPHLNYSQLFKGAPSIAGTKLLIHGHVVDPVRCIDCGTCDQGCPVQAIDSSTRRIDNTRCVACLGCLNNCPTGAMQMRFLGTPLYGFVELCRRHQVEIAEPPELA